VENTQDNQFIEVAKEIWVATNPDMPHVDEDIATIAAKIEELYPTCTIEMPVLDFGRLTDNARALFVTPLMEAAPEQTFIVYHPNDSTLMFVHQESGMPIEMSLAECHSIPAVYLTAVIGASQMAFVESAIRGEVEPLDPVMEQLRVMQEAQLQQAGLDTELKHLAMQIDPALQGSGNPNDSDNPDAMPAENDFISFESYLDVMRKMHSYEQMPPDHRVQFDHSVAYRWRDIKALKLILGSVDGNDGLNALGRFNAELVRVSMINDQTYLELSHLRNLMKHEVAAFREAANAQRKKSKFMAQTLEAFANRIEANLRLLGPMPPEAVDMLTRLNNMLTAKTAEAAENYDGVIRLSTEVERLREALTEEANYCYEHAVQLADSDPARSQRHRERGDRLMSHCHANMTAPEPQTNDNHVHAAVDTIGETTAVE
jgi:hypothetical protein